MRVPDKNLAEIWDRGYTVMENFIDPESLKAAQEALWTIHPRPEDYFADPSKYPKYTRSQFAGIQLFPFDKWELSRLCVYPDLIDLAERFLKTKEIDLYKGELWAKYSGAINYDQYHHRDYRNHTIVVPREDQLNAQMTTFILLSDVTATDGPTKVVPLSETRDIPMGTARTKFGTFFDKEVSIEGPAGSLMVYKTDVFHRGSNFTAPGRSRFAILTDFKTRAWRWQGKLAWPDHSEKAVWDEAMAKMSVRQRDLFGFPPPGSEYWNAQTLRDVQTRYPEMDMTPYRAGVA
ncbi:MAG TPA: phytanoyl-CoA dioxygenase family protein [Rhizomicrobium sp.]|nr:phytanoyl-CoA dioxygenase family protein [Rhizomicrobium sp.]